MGLQLQKIHSNYFLNKMSHFVNVTIWLLLLANISDGFVIEFYQDKNYTNFQKELEINGTAEAECHNVLDSGFRLGSIKTEKCLMIYPKQNCQRPDPPSNGGMLNFDFMNPWLYQESFRVDGNNPNVIRNLHVYNIPRSVASFHVCSQERGGGPSVDIDFYEKPDYNGNIIANFKDVCTCRNLPISLKLGESSMISIDNHGNTIDLFEEEHCAGQSRTLSAGYSWSSRKVWGDPSSRDAEKNGLFDIRSFRASGNVNCIKMEASIHKFVFRNGTGVQDGNVCKLTENVKLAADTILRANGNAKLVQEYSVMEKTSETLDFTISTAYSNMFTVGADLSYTAEVKGGVPFVAEGKGSTTVATTYRHQRTDSGTTTNRMSVTKEGTVSARQNIEIQPCNECRISSYLKMVKNFPIEYDAFAKITGTAAGRKMSAREIRAYLLPEVKYIGDIDEYSVDTVVTDVMYAEFGLNAFISAECNRIPGCVKTLRSGVENQENFSFEVPITNRT